MKRLPRQVLPKPMVLRPMIFPALLAALALAGCTTVGPDYRPPQIAIPAQWTAAADTISPDAAVLAEWWRQFADPVLDSLVADALAANLDLVTAQAQLREARARRGLAGAQLGPSVSVAASGSRSRSSAESGTGATRELYSTGFDASWEPDIFGSLRRGVAAAEADLGASTEVLRDTRVSLVAEVVLNYVDLRTAESRLAIAEASLAARSETYDLVRWRLQAGLVSELDVAQARTELESTRASLPPLRTAVAGARNRLAVLLGRAPGEVQARLVTTAAVPLAGRVAAAGIPADTLRQRPDVRAAERRLAAQTARLGEAEAARYPRFNLSGSLGLEALTLSALGSSGTGTHSLLGAITAPIFEFGRIGANIEIQDALLEQAVVTYRAAVLTALEEVENALVAVANASERRARLTLATDAARETLQIAEQRYASGLADFLSVLDSQRTLLTLEDQLASSTGELASAQIQLYKALGGGWSPAAESIATKESS
jgi:outer membrane protein, multidrug efflux system